MAKPKSAKASKAKKPTSTLKKPEPDTKTVDTNIPAFLTLRTARKTKDPAEDDLPQPSTKRKTTRRK